MKCVAIFISLQHCIQFLIYSVADFIFKFDLNNVSTIRIQIFNKSNLTNLVKNLNLK